MQNGGKRMPPPPPPRRQLLRLRSGKFGKFFGKCRHPANEEIFPRKSPGGSPENWLRIREIPREVNRCASSFPGNSPGNPAAGEFPGKCRICASNFPGNPPGRWHPHPISREIGIVIQISPISPILFKWAHFPNRH